MRTQRGAGGLSRRALLGGAGVFAAGALTGQGGRLLRPARAAERPVFPLVAAERPQALPCFGGRTMPLWTLSPDAALPVIRVRAGEQIRASVANRLTRPGEHVTIHWHGIRLANREDGVPYLTQKPIRPGESFDYAFTPPDAGTFFFHTHCNTAEQLGRGMAGIIIVEGDEDEPYDAERLLVLRDWTIGEDGAFGPFLTGEAGRAGTFGTVRSCNGETCPTVPVPAGADVRLRILNIDRTRVMQVGIEGVEAAVIAIDGNAVPPFPLKGWFLGPAMRIDVAMRSPAAGAKATLLDYFAKAPAPLAVFLGEGETRRTGAFDPAPLKPNPIAAPDLDAAERVTFDFSASTGTPGVVTTSSGQAPSAASDDPLAALDDLCTSPQTYWAINKRPWPGRNHRVLPPPIARLTPGKSYVFELRNQTPRQHPIHIHGHTFTVLGSNKRDLPRHHADTVLLQPKERIEAAFVADNPGDWMFHCHLVEHGETGMMSYLRVA